jgi:hypothetical protein
MKSLKVAQMPEVSSWISDGRQLEYRLSITATCRQRQTVAESAEQATSRRSRCKPLTPQRRKTQPSTYANLDALASSRESNCRGRPGDVALRPGGDGAWSQSFAQCPCDSNSGGRSVGCHNEAARLTYPPALGGLGGAVDSGWLNQIEWGHL